MKNNNNWCLLHHMRSGKTIQQVLAFSISDSYWGCIRFIKHATTKFSFHLETGYVLAIRIQFNALQWMFTVLKHYYRFWMKIRLSTFRSSSNFSVFITQSSVPIHLFMILLRFGLQKRIHLLGVTPFVLFWNFSGHNCKKKYAGNSV